MPLCRVGGLFARKQGLEASGRRWSRPARKLPRTMGSNPGHEMPGKGCKELHNPSENGQHHGCGLREQFGRNSVQTPSLHCQGPVDVVSAEGHSSSRSALPGPSERDGG